jgi:hypothetical protein
MKWAMIDTNNIVENVIIWDGIGDLFVGKTVVQLQEGEYCTIGSVFDPNATENRFSVPSNPEEN